MCTIRFGNHSASAVPHNPRRRPNKAVQWSIKLSVNNSSQVRLTNNSGGQQAKAIHPTPIRTTALGSRTGIVTLLMPTHSNQTQAATSGSSGPIPPLIRTSRYRL